MPGAKQAWPNSAACWSPATPLIGTPAPSGDVSEVTAEPAARRHDRGQHVEGHAEQLAQLGRPARRAGCRRASCGWRWWRRWRAPPPPVSFQISQVSMVPKATSGPGRTPPSVKQPLELGAREVRVEHEAGGGPHQRQVAGVAQLVAAAGGAPVLPHDGPVQRPAGAAVPGHDGLALVGDADRGDRSRRRRGGGADLAEHVDHGVPDLARRRAPPSPAWGSAGGTPGRRDAVGRPSLVEGDGPHPGGAGIDGDHDGHGRVSLRSRSPRVRGPVRRAATGASLGWRSFHRRPPRGARCAWPC